MVSRTSDWERLVLVMFGRAMASLTLQFCHLDVLLSSSTRVTSLSCRATAQMDRDRPGQPRGFGHSPPMLAVCGPRIQTGQIFFPANVLGKEGGAATEGPLLSSAWRDLSHRLEPLACSRLGHTDSQCLVKEPLPQLS